MGDDEKHAAAVKIQKIHRGKKSSAKQRLITVLMEADEALGTPRERIALTELSMKELKEMARDAGVSKQEIQKATMKAAKERLLNSKKAQQLQGKCTSRWSMMRACSAENKQKAIQICTEGSARRAHCRRMRPPCRPRRKSNCTTSSAAVCRAHQGKGKAWLRHRQVWGRRPGRPEGLAGPQGVYVEKDRDYMTSGAALFSRPTGSVCATSFGSRLNMERSNV